MNENSYEEYKRNLSRSRKRKEDGRSGKIMLIDGVCLLVFFFFILPYHAGNVSEIHGDEVKAGRNYDRIQVYYIKNLHILRAKTDTDGTLYGIAKFTDCDGRDWILCFTPGNDTNLAERIQMMSSFEDEFDLTIKGYFQLRYLKDLPSGANSFYRVYAGSSADADASNLLSLNADYLCGENENYTLAVLCRRGVPLVLLVAGLLGVLIGGFLLIRNCKCEIA